MQDECVELLDIDMAVQNAKMSIKIIDNRAYYGAILLKQRDNRIWVHQDDIDNFIAGIRLACEGF